MIKVQFHHNKKTEQYKGEAQPEIPPPAMGQAGWKKHADQKRDHCVSRYDQIKTKSDHIGDQQSGYRNIRDKAAVSY